MEPSQFVADANRRNRIRREMAGRVFPDQSKAQLVAVKALSRRLATAMLG